MLFVRYLSSISVFLLFEWPVFTRLFRIIIEYIESKPSWTEWSLVIKWQPTIELVSPTIQNLTETPVMLSVILVSDDRLSIQASDLWQQLELTSELKSGLQDTGMGQEMACWLQFW